MSMQKNKGNGFERECAKKLTEIYGEHFNRNISGSGNYLGGTNAYRKNILSESQIRNNKGDVICPDSFNGKFVIECKFYKEFPFHHFLIDKSIPILDKWIGQQYDIIDDGDFFVVIFKINRCGSFIVVRDDLCSFVDDRLTNHSIYHYNNEKYIVTDFERFMNLYKDEIKKKCE